MISAGNASQPSASAVQSSEPLLPINQRAATLPASQNVACADISVVSHSQLLIDGLTLLLAKHMLIRLADTYMGAVPTTPVSLQGNPPDHVVLLDSGVGQEQAVAWTRYWRAQAPPAHVVVLELANDNRAILACIEAGAGGYTLRGASAFEVAETIILVRQGLALCSPTITGQLFARLASARGEAAQPAGLSIPLTPRELEVLKYIASDYNNQEIAAALVIEIHTVKHHVHNILEKLKLHNRWEAARLASERGWLTASPPSPPLQKSQ